VAVPSVDDSLGTKLLPFVLSVIAGSADIIGFLGLGGLFVAHITGNLVILAARIVARDQAPLAQLIAVPVFVVALALTRLLGRWLGADPDQLPDAFAVAAASPALGLLRRVRRCRSGG